MNYDFSGWATRNNIRCSDGRTIKKDAFKECDGHVVPLVWNHQHNDPTNVLGHALLENRDSGVYAYCELNDTESGQSAKLLVEHGDVNALSIYANRLKQNGGDVLHGEIKEVSLVLAGANPGAYIDTIMSHSDDESEAAIIYSGEEIIVHGDEIQNEERIWNSMSAKQRNAIFAVVGLMLDDDDDDEEDSDDVSHSDDEDTETLGDILSSLNDEQLELATNLIVAATTGSGDDDDNDDNDDNDDSNVPFYILDDDEGDEDMKHNVFESQIDNNDNTLTHAEVDTIFKDAKRLGSLKEAVLAHSDDYGITQIDWLFPEAKNLNVTPDFIKRETGWVSNVMSGVSRSPFSRIKSMFADITEDEARAKGYVKGNRKKEEVFGLLKRSTTPTTIYKKQKIDRDDQVDIKDFDVAAWIKSEMRLMLDEEIARAILIGDGRSAASDDKIDETHIRPIAHDDDLFAIKKNVVFPTNATDDQKAKAIIRAAIKVRKDYKGSGEPTLFTTEDVLTDLLLLEDLNGRRIYESDNVLATAMRVKNIVTVPVMENVTRTANDGTVYDLLGIIVNLKDYKVGADKGGAISMFDDFDIDYNQQKYLIETRCSGALIKPYSAIVLETEHVS